VVVRAIAVILIALALTGCADGLSSDAQRGRKADESRDSIVTEMQATETWNLVHGTPEATPTPED
jgi:outer membrane lipoprotein SlyB